jgi:hypothetical protein
MKAAMWMWMWMWIACLGTVLGAGCMTDDAAEHAAVGQVDQGLIPVGGTGDAVCDGWRFCYQRCRRTLCTNPVTCAALTACLNNCDAVNYPAATYCPYP